MSTITVTPASAANLREIPRIELDAAAVFPESDLPAEIRYKVTAMEDLREASREQRLWVAKDSTEDVVGFAMADIVDDQGYLVEVDVSPEYFRRGIGTSLVGAVLDWGRREQFEYLALVTFRHLPWNAAFYEKLGFSFIDAAERGPGIEGLIQEEGKLGINIANRVTMRVVF